MTTVVTPDHPAKLTSWRPPAWTETVTVDGDQIECCRTLGTVPHPSVAGDTLTVTLVQRDEVVAGADRIEVVRHPVAVSVGGTSLSPGETEALTDLLTQATALINEPDGRG
jgi:hypothetical protein